MNILKILLGTGILFVGFVILFSYTGLSIIGIEDVRLKGLEGTAIYLGEGDACRPLSLEIICKPGLECVRDEFYMDGELGYCQRLNQTSVFHKVIE